MTPETAEIVRKELQATIAKLKRKVAKLKEDGERAICGPKGSVSEWTKKQRDDYFNTTSEQRCAKADRLMQEEIEHEFAAREFEHLLFSHNMRTRERPRP